MTLPVSSEQGHAVNTAMELEAADQLYTRQLLSNPMMLAAGLDEQYALRDHLRAIGRAWQWLANTPDARLLIQTPPQIGKSTSIEWGVLWWLSRNPRHRVVVGSYNRDLASRTGGHIRELITRHGEQLDVHLSPGNTAKQHFSTTGGGGVLSVGVGSGLTGHPAHLAVCDDPHKDRGEAESLRMRDAVWDWYSSTLLSRFQPGTRMVLVLTRWHEDDLAGRLLAHDGRESEGGAWRVLHMPAFADPDLSKDGDPLGRAPGEPLPHPGIPEEHMQPLRQYWEKRRRETPSMRDWHSLYQGDPKPPEGALVTAELMRSIRVFDPTVRPGKVRSAVAVDPAGGGRDTVGIVAGYRGTDNRLWITHDESGVINVDEWSRAVCRLACDTDADMIIYENNFGAAMPDRLIKTAWDGLQREGRIPAERMRPSIQAVRARQGKRLRAEPVAQAMQEDRVRLAAYMPDLESEWCSWMPTDPDSPGRIDASVYLGRRLLIAPGGGPPVSTVQDLERSEQQVARPEEYDPNDERFADFGVREDEHSDRNHGYDPFAGLSF